VSDTEPDAVERAALGAALAEPDAAITPAEAAFRAFYEPPHAPAWDCMPPVQHAIWGRIAEAAVHRAVADERERIAQVAEDLGVHYHGPDYDRTASFAAFLRGAKS
jgi:hypothetical protein